MKPLLIALLLCACTPVIQTEYVQAPLTHDPRPLLPKIAASELQCLSQETYQKLMDRNRLITGYAITLESLIESTQEKKHD